MRAVSTIAGERLLQCFERDFAAFAGQTLKFEPAAEKLRRAAFVGGDMGFGMTEHDTPLRRDLRQRQGIRRSAGRHQENRDIVFENLGHAPLDGSRPVIVAVAARIAAACFGNGIENGGRDGGRIVAGKIHGRSVARIVCYAIRQPSRGAAVRSQASLAATRGSAGTKSANSRSGIAQTYGP